MDREKSDRASVLDTQSIIAGKMGSGVSITPAKPKTPAPSSSSAVSGISNMSPAGLTLGSGVTIRPNKPAAASSGAAAGNGVSIVPVDKAANSNNSTSSSSGSSGSSTATSTTGSKATEADPNLTDDTYVVEAPSFIVPYVYEKPPKEEIKAFKESIEKIVEEKKKEKEKKREAGEEVSDDEEDKKKDKEDSDSEDEEEKKARKEKEAKEKEQKEKEKKDSKDNYFSSTLGKYFIDLGMNLEHNLEESKDKNEGFHFSLRKCKFCSFRTESR